jgi:hypothetical protein
MRLPSNLGMFCLAVWLITQGAFSLLQVSFPLEGVLLALLGIAAGVLLLMKK